MELTLDHLSDRCDAYNVAFSQRLLDLEQKYERLEARMRASSTAKPMDRGMTFWPEGDPIPSHGINDLLDGKVWIFREDHKEVPLIFTKNKTGRALLRGECLDGRVVDSQLRFSHVAPNNFFWLEL